MRPFEYAHPETEAEALELLADHGGNTAVLAGGTDLLSLLKRDLLQPARVVNIKNIPKLSGVKLHKDGVLIGANTTLDEIEEHALSAEYRSLVDVIDGIRAIQITSNGTIAGDLCHLPNCWYFRNGYGLLAMQNGESLVATGDNRYHAILGNSGPAKFVSASRFAPPLIAWGAKVRVVTRGQGSGVRSQDETALSPQSSALSVREEWSPLEYFYLSPRTNTHLSVRVEWLPLEYFYLSPKTNTQGVTVLKPCQLVTHVWLPAARDTRSATYEVLQMEGLDWPLASAAVCVGLENDIVREAKIVLGHVAPTPWLAHEASKWLVGQRLTNDIAETAGRMAVANATPLSHNEYKVQIAQTAVKRALLKATGKLAEIV